MTILVNQKLNEESHSSDQQNQNKVVSNTRTNRLNVINENQADFQGGSRDKRTISGSHGVYDDTTVRNMRTSNLKSGKTKSNKRDRDKGGGNESNKTTKTVTTPHHSNNDRGSQMSGAGAVHNPNGLLNSNSGACGVDEKISGYNSGDEHAGQRDAVLTTEEWDKRDANFVKAIADRGLVVNEIAEDGACLFRAIALQIYGDQDMHEVIRHHTMDYIQQNREYFAQFVTEDIGNYISRKRHNHVHGNHIEIQAMSEIYNRPVELYCYGMEPINIFNSEQINNGYEPLRLSYQRCSHYNAIVNPYKASVGVGLGLAGYRPDEPETKQIKDAVRQSEEHEIEQAMFEDKLKTTDWEATNEAIEEQIARESYLQWCRDNLKHAEYTFRGGATTSSTVTSTAVSTSNVNSSSCSPTENNKVSSVCGVGGLVMSGGGGGGLSTDNPINGDNSNPNNNDLMNNEHGPSCSQPKNSPNSKCDGGRFHNNNSYFYTAKRRRYHRLSPPQSQQTQTAQPPPQIQNEISINTVVGGTTTIPRKRKLSRNCSTHGVSGGSDSGPSTSASHEQSNETGNVQPSLSRFYQSLLESSYTDDGQLTENEMIQRALQLSRLDYIQNNSNTTSNHNQNLQGSCSTSRSTTSYFIDEEYDSSP